MAMFSMFVTSPSSGTPVNTVYQEKQAFGPFGAAAGIVSPDSGFSEALWLEVAQSAPQKFRTLYAFCAGEIRVVGTQAGFPIAPDSPLIVALKPRPRPEMQELDRICRASQIETPLQIFYHGLSPDSLKNNITPLLTSAFRPIVSIDEEGNIIETVEVPLEELQESFLKGQLKIYLGEIGLGAGVALGEVSDKNLSAGHIAFGIEIRTGPPLALSSPLSGTLTKNYLDPVVVYHELIGSNLSDGTPAILATETSNSWLEVVTKDRVLITFRDEWNAPLTSGDNAVVEGTSAGQNVVMPLTDEQHGTIVAPDGWSQYTCQISVPSTRKMTPIVLDQGASDTVSLNVSAPAHRVIGSVRPEDWFHTTDPPLLDATKALQLFTEGNLVEPLIDGFRALSNKLNNDLISIDSPEQFVLLCGWKTVHDFDLIPGAGGATTLERYIKDANFIGAKIRALLWDRINFMDSWTLIEDKNSDTADMINALANGRAILDNRTLSFGSHHVKCVVIHNSRGIFAHLGGMDINPNRLDDPAHEPDGKKYHDVHCRIEGPAVVDVIKAFADRWNDHPEGGNMGISTPIAVPLNVGTNFVQIARTYGAGTQSYAPNGIREIWATLKNAIRRAKKYVYLEEQYLWYKELSDELLTALDRIDHLVIVFTENCEDTAATSGGERQDECDRARYLFLNPLRTLHPEKLHVFTLRTHGKPMTVHSKVVIIDDIFAAIGSANMNRRGMTHDTELNAFIVDGQVEEGVRKFARDLRITLWAEHLGWHRSLSLAKVKLANVDRAIEWLTNRRPSTARLNTYNLVKGAGSSYPALWDSITDPDGSTP